MARRGRARWIPHRRASTRRVARSRPGESPGKSRVRRTATDRTVAIRTVAERNTPPVSTRRTSPRIPSWTRWRGRSRTRRATPAATLAECGWDANRAAEVCSSARTRRTPPRGDATLTPWTAVFRTTRRAVRGRRWRARRWRWRSWNGVGFPLGLRSAPVIVAEGRAVDIERRAARHSVRFHPHGVEDDLSEVRRRQAPRIGRAFPRRPRSDVRRMHDEAETLRRSRASISALSRAAFARGDGTGLGVSPSAPPPSPHRWSRRRRARRRRRPGTQSSRRRRSARSPLVDLHGLTVDGAIATLRTVLAGAARTDARAVRVVCGAGRHSVGGRARVAPAVRGFLETRGSFRRRRRTLVVPSRRDERAAARVNGARVNGSRGPSWTVTSAREAATSGDERRSGGGRDLPVHPKASGRNHSFGLTHHTHSRSRRPSPVLGWSVDWRGPVPLLVARGVFPMGGSGWREYERRELDRVRAFQPRRVSGLRHPRDKLEAQTPAIPAGGPIARQRGTYGAEEVPATSSAAEETFGFEETAAASASPRTRTTRTTRVSSLRVRGGRRGGARDGAQDTGAPHPERPLVQARGPALVTPHRPSTHPPPPRIAATWTRSSPRAATPPSPPRAPRRTPAPRWTPDSPATKAGGGAWNTPFQNGDRDEAARFAKRLSGARTPSGNFVK